MSSQRAVCSPGSPDTFTPILGGLLADYVMEPAMQNGGWAANLFGWMVGTGPGSGMAAMMVVFGALTVLTLMSGYVFPQIRNMEILLPDHNQLEKISEKGPAMGTT